MLVFEKIYIPGYGMGPFITPIEVNDPLLIADIKRRSRIKVIQEKKVDVEVKEEAKKDEVIYKEFNTEDGPVTELPKEEPVEEPVKETEPEEKVEEPVEELAEEPEEDIDDDGLELKTVSELKEILDNMGVSHLYKDTKPILIEKIRKNR